MVETRRVELRKPAVQRAVVPRYYPRIGAQSLFRSGLSEASTRRFHQISLLGVLERPAGNDPASSRWQRETLPLSYGRMVGDG